MMYGRAGLDRFKKAQSLEPFSVTTVNSASKSSAATKHVTAHSSVFHPQQRDNVLQEQHRGTQNPAGQEAVAPLVGQTQVGGGQSTWQPPDWAIEPWAGVYYLEVLKDGEVLDRINLDRQRHVFGRQFHTCDFVLDHQSVSRQHAAVVPHRNGGIYVIDLGSAHGTFVANERLTKDTPAELEVGQSLRFAASTRTYILRKNNEALFPRPPLPTEIDLPPPPDPSDEEAVVVYNTLLNRYGINRPVMPSKSGDTGSSVSGTDDSHNKRPAKRMKKARVAFRDQVGGELEEVVGISDGVDVETEPGPIGVKEGTLVGKYESLVQITVIPKGKEQNLAKEDSSSQKGVTVKLQEALNKVKNAPKSGIYDDLYGESFAGKVGSSWAYPAVSSSVKPASPTEDTVEKSSSVKSDNKSSHVDDDDDDLFGD